MSKVSPSMQTSSDVATRTVATTVALFWLYPLLLILAEALVAVGRPLAGLLVHAATALLLSYHSAFGAAGAARRLALALLLVPLLRIVALALPPGGSALLTYTLAGGSMLVATLLVGRTLRVRPSAVGLTLGELWMQLMVMGCGVALGYLGAQLLPTTMLTDYASWQTVAALAVALLVFAGFAEELIFRGLLQTVSGPLLGRWGPLYVALVFGGVQLGFGSPLYALLAFIVGLVFAGVVRLSGSIIGVALAHGLASIVILLVMPYVRENPDSMLAAALQPLMLVGGACAALAVVMLVLTRIPLRVGVPAPPHVGPSDVTLAPSAAQIARLRRDARLTYVELALRVGLPARLIAEIELGLRPLEPEVARRIGAKLAPTPSG